MPEFVDLVVDVGLFLDVGVGGGHVGFGLVVVVVGDEVLDGVLREEVAELLGELGGERLVGGDDERRLLDGLDGFGHRVRFAGAGHAQQRLPAHAVQQAGRQPLNRLRLVAAGLEVRDDAERLARLGGVERRQVAGVVASGRRDASRHRFR